MSGEHSFAAELMARQGPFQQRPECDAAFVTWFQLAWAEPTQIPEEERRDQQAAFRAGWTAHQMLEESA